jgi:hypothetical protein
MNNLINHTPDEDYEAEKKARKAKAALLTKEDPAITGCCCCKNQTGGTMKEAKLAREEAMKNCPVCNVQQYPFNVNPGQFPEAQRRIKKKDDNEAAQLKASTLLPPPPPTYN